MIGETPSRRKPNLNCYVCDQSVRPTMDDESGNEPVLCFECYDTEIRREANERIAARVAAKGD